MFLANLMYNHLYTFFNDLYKFINYLIKNIK